jgi:hypothetical protein
MVHLFTGKQAKPGNGAFSLTGQPSACGTAREVGTFAHRLPADMLVDNAEHRATGERAWALPSQSHHRDDARSGDRQGQVAVGPGHQFLPIHRQRQPLAPRRAREGLFRGGLRRVSDAVIQGGGSHPAFRDDLREVGRLRKLGAPHTDVARTGAAAGRSPQRSLADHGVLQSPADLGPSSACPDGEVSADCSHMLWQHGRTGADASFGPFARPEEKTT